MSEALNALWTLTQRTTYFDGTTRTEGVDSAGTWTRLQTGSPAVTEILLWMPPTLTALNQRIMIGGSTATYAAPMQLNELFVPQSGTTLGALHVNLVKNAGGGPADTNRPVNAVAAWGATPYGTGDLFGWGKWWPRQSGAGTLHFWEAKECIAVVITNATLDNVFGFIGGAIVDPETNDTITDGESDGRLYGIIRTAGRTDLNASSRISPTFYTDTYSRTSSSINNFRFLNANHVGNTDPKGHDQCPYAACFSPNSSALVPMYTMTSFVEPPTAATLKTRSGQFGRMAIIYRSGLSDNVIGRLREIFMFTDAQLAQRLTSGSTPVGYVISGSGVSNCDGILLEHA
jgi:hypothetical protein